MKYKVVTLILIIPLVLMVCVFSAAKVAELKVPIPVTGVTVFHNPQEVVNLVEGNTFQINAQVMPRNASNSGLSYDVEAVSNKPLPDITISETGLVTANGYGTAKILVTTNDSAYTKSFILEVTSTKAVSLIANLSTTEKISLGDEFSVLANVLPKEALDKNVVFSSSDPNKVTINSITGACRAITSGEVILTATLNNGLNGVLKQEIPVFVYPNVSSHPITFQGGSVLTEKIFDSTLTANMEINFSELHALGYNLTTDNIILEYDSSKVSSVKLNPALNTGTNGIYNYTITLDGITDSFTLKAYVNFENYKDYASEINVEKIADRSQIEVSLNSNDLNSSYIKTGQEYHFSVNVTPQFEGYYLNFIPSDSSNLIITEEQSTQNLKTSQKHYKLIALQDGEYSFKIEVKFEDEIVKISDDFAFESLTPSGVTLTDTTKTFATYGTSEMLVVGSLVVKNNEFVNNNKQFAVEQDLPAERLLFESLNKDVVDYINGEFTILKEGIATIKVTEKNSKLLGDPNYDEITIRCVDGVEVGTYQDLLKATECEILKDGKNEIGKQVVLINDINLGEKLIEVNETTGERTELNPTGAESILKSEVRSMPTSWEWNYYKNNPEIKATTPPNINYIIKFTKNCYGNGFELNANNITNIIDGTGKPYPYAVFKGPLDYVGIPGASVKAQDNICFIASDNVMLHNVELTGANLSGLDTTDLVDLNYVGTVLEVMGDNVKVVNSRIKNGRNCVRVYGKESGNLEKINVLIEGCIISYAREFLIKMGTNSKLYGNFENAQSYNLSQGNLPAKVWEECSPKINGYRHLNDGKLTNDQYNALVQQYLNDKDYLDLIKTNLTVKNCILSTSGLFSIGIESSFSGPALDGGRWNSWNFKEYGWVDIVGTSYPTMLNLEGSVKMYDWKEISHIDSSTLIEGNMFSLNIKEMIETLYEGDFTDIISEMGGKRYAHGGIVMYGGGKNYCLINNNLTSENGINELNNYSLSLDTLKSSLTTMLKYASGQESFRIFMYGKFSQFNQAKQNGDFLNLKEYYKGLEKYVF